MRLALPIAALLLAACERGADPPTGEAQLEPDRRSAVQTETLTGLYQPAGNPGQSRSRLCMVSEESGGTTFGLMIERAEGSCGGAGRAVRNGTVVRLTMAGESECAVDASMNGTLLTFPASVAPGCDYYCAPGVSLASRTFEKTGGTAADALRATDLAGDPLCG